MPSPAPLLLGQMRALVAVTDFEAVLQLCQLNDTFSLESRIKAACSLNTYQYGYLLHYIGVCA